MRDYYNFSKLLSFFKPQSGEKRNHKVFDLKGIRIDKKEKLILDDKIVYGSLKMIEGFFQEQNIRIKYPQLINHPVNLDQAVSSGFVLHCESLGMEEDMIILILAVAFSDFLVNGHDFYLEVDKETDSTLKIMKAIILLENGNTFSIFPCEHTFEVFQKTTSFEILLEKIKEK